MKTPILIVISASWIAACVSGCHGPYPGAKSNAAAYYAGMDRTAIIEQWKSETKPSEFAGDLNDPHLVDVLPIPISMPMPSIPSGSVERGKVVLDFVVSSAGDVGAIKVVESTSGRLSEIAIQIVSRWKYKPGRLNDKPVAVLLRIPLVF